MRYGRRLCGFGDAVGPTSGAPFSAQTGARTGGGADPCQPNAVVFGCSRSGGADRVPMPTQRCARRPDNRCASVLPQWDPPRWAAPEAGVSGPGERKPGCSTVELHCACGHGLGVADQYLGPGALSSHFPQDWPAGRGRHCGDRAPEDRGIAGRASPIPVSDPHAGNRAGHRGPELVAVVDEAGTSYPCRVEPRWQRDPPQHLADRLAAVGSLDDAGWHRRVARSWCRPGAGRAAHHETWPCL